jgi:hypothetical protein
MRRIIVIDLDRGKSVTPNGRISALAMNSTLETIQKAGTNVTKSLRKPEYLLDRSQ